MLTSVTAHLKLQLHSQLHYILYLSPNEEQTI